MNRRLAVIRTPEGQRIARLLETAYEQGVRAVIDRLCEELDRIPQRSTGGMTVAEVGMFEAICYDWILERRPIGRAMDWIARQNARPRPGGAT